MNSARRGRDTFLLYKCALINRCCNLHLIPSPKIWCYTKSWGMPLIISNVAFVWHRPLLMSRHREFVPSSPFSVSAKRRTWSASLRRSRRRCENVYLSFCCMCKESSSLCSCNSNADVPTGAYFLSFSRPTHRISLCVCNQWRVTHIINVLPVFNLTEKACSLNYCSSVVFA